MNLEQKKEQEKIARLYEKYSNVNVMKLDDDELDWQIVDLGRNCTLDDTENLSELLKTRKEERWARKLGYRIDDGAEIINKNFCDMVEGVYMDVLGTARMLKKRLDDKKEPYLQILQVQFYADLFKDGTNRFIDEKNNLPGLLDIIMDEGIMRSKDTFRITFEIRDGEGIKSPPLEDFFQPSKEDFAWNLLMDKKKSYMPAAKLCYPLRKIYMDYDVAMQDILNIKRFDFYVKTWKGVR